MRYLLAVSLCMLLMLAIVAPYASAQTQPAGKTNSPAEVGPVLGNFLNELYNTALRVVGLAIFSMFLYAGLTKLIPGMKGNPVTIIQDAVIGLIILASAYVILNSIHPNLVNLGNLELGTIPEPAGGVTVSDGTGTGGGGGGGDGGGGASDIIERKSASGTTLRFIRAGGACGAALPCEPGYTCQGAVCKWAGAHTIAQNSYCMQSSQCVGSDQRHGIAFEVYCTEVYGFQSSPGMVRKCCPYDSVHFGITGTGPEYCED